MLRKIFIVFLILSTFIFHPALSENLKESLEEADSLFSQKKYTEAFTLYENIFQNSDQFSLQMLLKMAFIKEATGDYTSALYYLNVYYKYNPNKKVLKKMEDLAGKYKLTGYRYTDLEYFISLYNQYYYYISFSFLFFAVSYFGYLIIKKFQKKKLGFRPLVFILILATAYIFANYDIIPPKGIISKQGTWLMSAPSSASEPVAMIDKGHRVMILEKQDIWYRILWEDKSAYILESHLLLIGEPRSFNIF